MTENVGARTLLIACGALAREIAALKRANGWSSVDVRCLPAQLHNRPERIAPAVQAEIQTNRGRYANMFVVYGDCGTRGTLDAVLKEEGVERLPGAHCYEFLATSQVFAQLSEAELEQFQPTLVYADANNRISHTNRSIPKQMAAA